MVVKAAASPAPVVLSDLKMRHPMEEMIENRLGLASKDDEWSQEEQDSRGTNVGEDDEQDAHNRGKMITMPSVWRTMMGKTMMGKMLRDLAKTPYVSVA